MNIGYISFNKDDLELFSTYISLKSSIESTTIATNLFLGRGQVSCCSSTMVNRLTQNHLKLIVYFRRMFDNSY